MIGLGASFVLFYTIHSQSRPPPGTMNKEYQEMSNEYLKVCPKHTSNLMGISFAAQLFIYLKPASELLIAFWWNRAKIPNPSPVMRLKTTRAKAWCRADRSGRDTRWMSCRCFCPSTPLPLERYIINRVTLGISYPEKLLYWQGRSLLAATRVEVGWCGYCVSAIDAMYRNRAFEHQPTVFSLSLS